MMKAHHDSDYKLLEILIYVKGTKQNTVNNANCKMVNCIKNKIKNYPRN